MLINILETILYAIVDLQIQLQVQPNREVLLAFLMVRLNKDL